MTRGSMVLSKGVRIGTLYRLDACTIQCNSTSVKSKKRVLDSSSSPIDQEKKKTIVFTSNGHAFWVPKGANTLEMKLPTEKTMLWHQRLGHISEKGLRALKNKSLVVGLDDCNLEFDFHKHCICGKQHCVSFYSSFH